MTNSPQKNWFERNWKWFVPVLVVTVLFVFILSIAGLFFGITSIMKRSETYQYPMKLVNDNARITELLGSPVESGFMIQGNINISGGSGNSNISIPIKGPKGKGVIYVNAVKKAGVWEYKVLSVCIKGERIDLAKENLQIQ